MDKIIKKNYGEILYTQMNSGVEDLNNLYNIGPEAKLVRVGHNTLNTPSPGSFSGVCLHVGGSENWQTQFAIQVGSDRIYKRYHNTSGWTEWTYN